MSADRDWLYEGAKVGIRELGYRDSCRVGEVARFTKTRVVLTDGSWFHIDNLQAPSRGTWSPIIELVPITDPQFVRALMRQQLMSAADQVSGAVHRLGSKPSTEALLDLQRHAERLAAKCEALRSQS